MRVQGRSILAILLLLLASSLEGQNTTSGAIRGRVIAKGVGAGAQSARLRNLRVLLDNGRFGTTTDSTGRFELHDLPAGIHSLVVLRLQQQLAARVVTVTNGDTADVEIQEPGGETVLAPVIVSADRALHVIGHLGDVDASVIYAGKKNEVILIDSLHANVAQDVERQILGRIPGAHFSETAGAGFPSNGVGFRGLDPTQSVELNTRQNGVGIAADLFGYPETYYTPPAEALDRIEVVRGAGSLAFGPQFGGAINYVVRRGEFATSPAFTSRQTTGSYGLLNSFNAIGGGSRSLSYYAFFHYRGADGWRPNSDYRQTAAYASTTWRATDRLTLSAEHTRYRNRIHMAGGLSDEQFAADPSQSFRARNWLASPWNITALRARVDLSPQLRLESTLSYMASNRHLVWRNEDGGPASLDEIDPATGTYVPREAERESFENWTSESRVRLDHALFGRGATLTTGLRAGWNRMYRFAGGAGSTGFDFDMNLYGGTWERALYFRTPNVAAFAEELIRPTDRLSVTFGARREVVRSSARGYTDVDSVFAPQSVAYNLFGVGTEYMTGTSTAFYANVTQAYRPILYEALTPLGSITRVDPNLRAAHGYNAEAGWRGTLWNALKFDLGAFYLSYRDRIGTRTGVDGTGAEFSESTNIGNSVHRGGEAYLELDPFEMNGRSSRMGNVDLFTSFAYVDARYVSGQFKGNRVEQAPRVTSRAGLTYALGVLASTIQASHSADAFGDANNSVLPTDDAVAGVVPSYTVVDYSAQLAIGSYQLSFGVNNLTDARYFTKRTGEYPGPGILPGAARSFYLGIGAHF